MWLRRMSELRDAIETYNRYEEYIESENLVVDDNVYCSTSSVTRQITEMHCLIHYALPAVRRVTVQQYRHRLQGSLHCSFSTDVTLGCEIT